MKRIIILTLACSLFISLQTSAQLKAAIKKTLELKMPKTAADENCGTRGASVVWHPIQKKYYASFAGNKDYPLAVFSPKGKRLSGDNLSAMADVRGLWYNPANQSICGNAFDDGGWFSYTLNEKGIIDNSTVNIEGMNQPDAQSVGVYNPVRDEVFFLNKNLVYQYTNDGMSEEFKQIHFGTKPGNLDVYEDEDEETPAEYNNTTLIYTGVKDMEIGVLNADNKQIELYDFATGYLRKIITLPSDAPVEHTFNFSYANGIYWLFDITKRTWIGYK